jgi:putative addiction module component (TIGR02574 family)
MQSSDYALRPRSDLCNKEDRKMSKKLEEIINEAMALGLEERAQLAGSLLLSLDEPTESEVERLWLQEAERRLQEYREGKVKGILVEEVFNRAITDLS